MNGSGSSVFSEQELLPTRNDVRAYISVSALHIGGLLSVVR